MEKFEESFKRFEEILDPPQEIKQLDKRYLIELTTKRFEYMFESLWKLLKEYYRKEGIETLTPMQSFKEVFKTGIIKNADETILFEMVNKRNQIVHVYDAEDAENIFQFIIQPQLYHTVNTIYLFFHSQEVE